MYHVLDQALGTQKKRQRELVVETEKWVAAAYRVINAMGAGQGDVPGFMNVDSPICYSSPGVREEEAILIFVLKAWQSKDEGEC